MEHHPTAKSPEREIPDEATAGATMTDNRIAKGVERNPRTSDPPASRSDPSKPALSHESTSLIGSRLDHHANMQPPQPQSHGGDDVPEAPDETSLQQTNSGVPPLPAISLPRTGAPLGNLHKRRASTSPQKFNTGKFEPLPLRTNLRPPGISESSAKRARRENKVEIRYDSSGTPRIASVTPTWSLPTGELIVGSQLFSDGRFESWKEPFSVFNGMLRHNDLLLLLVSYLNIPSLMSLYSISKPFHSIFNRHHTAFVVSSMRTWAPKADAIYPWRCYQSLCLKDPCLRQKSSMVGKDVQKKHEDLRDVPSLRWLQMVIWRQGVCKDMLIQLATKGLRCPRGTLEAVKRMWFIMDLPLNAHRIALCRSQAYITNDTISRATVFFLKVDMAFTDPICAAYPTAGPNTNTHAYPRRYERKGFVGCELREMLMAERSLTHLWRVLHGWGPDPARPAVPMNRLDVLRLQVRHRYRLPASASEETKKLPIMGVPAHEVGQAGYERTGVTIYQLGEGKTLALANPAFALLDPRKEMLYPHSKHLIIPSVIKPREPLLRPDDLMMREAIRRQMSLHTKWTRMMLWGFCDNVGRNYPIRSEEELLKWNKGQRPLHPLLSDEEFLRRKAEGGGKVDEWDLMENDRWEDSPMAQIMDREPIVAPMLDAAL